MALSVVIYLPITMLTAGAERRRTMNRAVGCMWASQDVTVTYLPHCSSLRACSSSHLRALSGLVAISTVQIIPSEFGRKTQKPGLVRECFQGHGSERHKKAKDGVIDGIAEPPKQA